MKIAIFGGTGFVGSYIIDELISSGMIPSMLVRQGSKHKLSQAEKCEIVNGDISDISAIKETIQEAEAIIYLIGIIREFPRKGITYENLHFAGARDCMDLAGEMGIKRFILMSANGVKMDGTGYQQTKFIADQYLKNTDLDWTIFRPSLIFGDPHGQVEFCSQLKNDMLSLPIPAPLFFNGFIPQNAGDFSMTPIHVTDVAKCFVRALKNNSSIGKTYELGGQSTFTWKKMIDLIAEAIGKKKWKIPAPAFPIKMAGTVLDRFSWFPISGEQLTMLMEGNTCDGSKAFQDFNIDPVPFSLETLAYLRG
ncbi:MAG: NAD(P)H-binding protein [Candidatus Marinimicrobia bacterium]|nr:NAD(P)H-binding protein [Candidatus Neomarinimicrobiota bacterium]MBL7009654.1 NAD(P)H-binding protein [Candidatus Neomarinimicrobiota bacterium]MBL7029603.1 NAD(P)H-binding protein [Candidatus Neomarinimicrobiota bacterium]